MVARVAGAFGVRGEVRLHTFTETPMAVATYKALLDEAGKPVFTLEAARPVKDGLVAKTLPVLSREAVEGLKGKRLFVTRDALPPPDEDEFYLADLIGLVVRDADAEATSPALGKIKAVHDFGAGDILEIAPDGGGQGLMLAFTRANVPEVDMTAGAVYVRLPAEIEADPQEDAYPEAGA